MQETWEKQIQSLGWEDPLEKEITTHFSILAWRLPGTEEPGGLQSMGVQRIKHNLRVNNNNNRHQNNKMIAEGIAGLRGI